jgi:hypothetical protein
MLALSNRNGEDEMMSELEFSPGELTALLTVNYEPLKKCSDGRWRSITKLVPVDGIDNDDVLGLWLRQLIDLSPGIAVATSMGRFESGTIPVRRAESLEQAILDAEDGYLWLQ